MQWNDSTMSVGVEKVDNQHKHLLALLNLAQERVAESYNRDEMSEFLGQLCDYVVEHFETEEELMVPGAYAEYDRHMAEHMDCTAKALAFLQEFNEGKNVDLPQFLDFVSNWVVEHVLGTDQTLKVFLQEQVTA